MADYRKEVGHRIRQLRLAKHMSQEDLAHHAGVTVKTVSRWENGRHSGYLGNVKALAEALDVEPEDITGTLPAPLGLGAPGLVTGPEERLVEMDAKIDRILSERLTLIEEIEEQNKLLTEQSQLLADIREAVAVLKGVKAAEVTQRDAEPARDAPARPEVPPTPRDRCSRYTAV